MLPRVDGSTSAQSRPTFAASVANLSEPGGYFDTDNLISNERSYLQVIPDLRRRSVRRRRLHRRRPRPELFVHRRGSAGHRLHRRRPARQPAAPPAVQGALRAVRDPNRISLVSDGTSAPARPERLAAGADRSPGRLRGQDARQRRRHHDSSPAGRRRDSPHRRAVSHPKTSDHRRLSPAVHRRRRCPCDSTARADRRSCITRPIAICCSRPMKQATRPTISRRRRPTSSSSRSRPRIGSSR